MDVGIGGHRGAHIDADGGGVDELDLLNAGGFHSTDMLRQFCAPEMAASSAGIRLSSTSVVLPEPDTPVTTVSLPFGNVGLQRLDRVDRAGGQVDAPLFKQLVCRGSAAGTMRLGDLPQRYGPIWERGLSAESVHRALRDDLPAVRHRLPGPFQ